MTWEWDICPNCGDDDVCEGLPYCTNCLESDPFLPNFCVTCGDIGFTRYCECAADTY